MIRYDASSNPILIQRIIIGFEAILENKILLQIFATSLNLQKNTIDQPSSYTLHQKLQKFFSQFSINLGKQVKVSGKKVHDFHFFTLFLFYTIALSEALTLQFLTIGIFCTMVGKLVYNYLKAKLFYVQVQSVRPVISFN